MTKIKLFFKYTSKSFPTKKVGSTKVHNNKKFEYASPVLMGTNKPSFNSLISLYLRNDISKKLFEKEFTELFFKEAKIKKIKDEGFNNVLVVVNSKDKNYRLYIK